MSSLRSRVAFAAALSLSACSAPPRPELAIAPSVLSSDWGPGAAAGPNDAVGLETGWSAFRSPELTALIARARAANTDIAIARARILQARGQLGVARAAGIPSVGLSGTADALRTSSRTGVAFTNDHSAGLDIAWDLDLFGANRAGKRAALARLVASQFDRDATELAVESEVARAYVAWATLTDRLIILDRALANARELERIIAIRRKEGVATRVDLGLQTIEVRRYDSQRSEMAEARGHALNALALLVGEEAPRFHLAEAKLDGFAYPDFRPVQPGELLVRRPDIEAAEARIHAAQGDVDRARRAFLPSISISAHSLGQGLAAGGPLQAVLSASASILSPIFSGGRLRGNLMSASGAQIESVETYRAALLTATREGADALTGLDESRRRMTLLAESLEEARVTARLARRQYVEGAADLQTVLNAERGLLDLEDAHALAAQDRLDAAIDLYKAMGGAPAR
jgi:NodT family efflux transporter outer membrane factor (OMF) lipoprotein